jgi:asparagine synthase (glutamine-hydrolysing)
LGGGVTDCSDCPIDGDIAELVSYFRDKQGIFSFIYESDNLILLASDIIGSKPLFYSLYQNNIYISDDAFLIAKEIGAAIDKEAVNEYYNACFVSYDRTLFKEIKQVLPGEFIIIYKNELEFRIGRHRYYCLDYDESSKIADKELETLFYKELYQVFGDLIKRLDGRTAVIPLSGGYDSRTIAVMLREHKYDNVICFSYGKKGNYEAKISQRIAKHLGYTWLFVEYSGTKWNSVFKSKEYKNFLLYAGRGRSAGCIQGLPAILELKSKKLIPEDSVIIPGHTLDVLAGSHLHLKDRDFPITKKEYLDNLVYMHYSCNRGLRIQKKEDKISEPLPEMITKAEYLIFNQRFEYYNRQNKFVANDIRTYESAGYDCELPFWDIRICDFWSKVPFQLLEGRKLQSNFTKAYINTRCGLENKENMNLPTNSSNDCIQDRKGIKRNIKEALACIPLIHKWGYIFYLALSGRYNNEGDWAAFWDMKRITYLIHCIRYGQMTVNGRAAKDYIALIKKELK